MLRVFGEFLLLFWLLGMVVHLTGFAQVFGVVALVLFAIDLLLAATAKTHEASKARPRTFSTRHML
jgi:hypothetical protein